MSAREMISAERISFAASGWRAMLSIAVLAVSPCAIAGKNVLQATAIAAAIAMIPDDSILIYPFRRCEISFMYSRGNGFYTYMRSRAKREIALPERRHSDSVASSRYIDTSIVNTTACIAQKRSESTIIIIGAPIGHSSYSCSVTLSSPNTFP